MSLPGASEKHGSVGLLVRDVEIEVMSYERENDVIGIADGFQLTASHTLHQIILAFRHGFPPSPHPLSLKNTVHHTVLLQNNDPNECG